MHFRRVLQRIGYRFALAAFCAAVAIFASSCGGGSSGGGDSTPPAPPAAPAGVAATPGNAQITLSWSAVTGATSYNVYTSTTTPVTTSGTKTTVTSAGATIFALANDTPVFAAVTAVNAGGESPFSSGVCAVPTAADTAGLTLYDPLCGGTFDGQKWLNPLFSRSVSGGAMMLSSEVANAESRTVKFQSYSTAVNVNTTSRVTTLTATVNVPASTASRSGTAEIRGFVQLNYEPPANRLQAPGALLDLLVVQVGLIDAGSGLQAFRVIQHCDSADCLSRAATGVAITDPAGFTPNASFPDRSEAAAAYDTSYTFSVSLNETTGVFNWSVAGGGFGGGVSGTADPTTYLAGNSNWTALGANPLSTGGGFLVAQLASRVLDPAPTGGSSGKVAAKFNNVQVGLNNAAATLYDDFGGTGSNSGANGELSLAKWTNAGIQIAALSGGSYAGHLQATSVSTSGFSSGQAITFNGDPANINTMQADITITSCPASAAQSTNRVELLGNFFNDGSAGPNTPPDTNQANSNVGDVRAIFSLDCARDQANFQIVRFNTQNTSTLLTNGIPVVPKGSAPVLGNTHTLRMSYNPVTHVFTFQADAATPVVVDPTSAGPLMATPVAFSKAANAPIRQVFWLSSAPPASAAGSTASLDFNMNNVFTAP